eukprot:g15357.t1
MLGLDVDFKNPDVKVGGKSLAAVKPDVRPVRIVDLLGRPGAMQRMRRLLGKPVAPRSIAQGTLGNCYFLAIVGPGGLLLEPDAVSPNGLYAVNFFVDGEWITVLVDDRIPTANTDAAGSPCGCGARGFFDHAHRPGMLAVFGESQVADWKTGRVLKEPKRVQWEDERAEEADALEARVSITTEIILKAAAKLTGSYYSYGAGGRPEYIAKLLTGVGSKVKQWYIGGAEAPEPLTAKRIVSTLHDVHLAGEIFEVVGRGEIPDTTVTDPGETVSTDPTKCSLFYGETHEEAWKAVKTVRKAVEEGPAFYKTTQHTAQELFPNIAAENLVLKNYDKRAARNQAFSDFCRSPASAGKLLQKVMSELFSGKLDFRHPPRQAITSSSQQANESSSQAANRKKCLFFELQGHLNSAHNAPAGALEVGWRQRHVLGFGNVNAESEKEGLESLSEAGVLLYLVKRTIVEIMRATAMGVGFTVCPVSHMCPSNTKSMIGEVRLRHGSFSPLAFVTHNHAYTLEGFKVLAFPISSARPGEFLLVYAVQIRNPWGGKDSGWNRIRDENKPLSLDFLDATGLKMDKIDLSAALLHLLNVPPPKDPVWNQAKNAVWSNQAKLKKNFGGDLAQTFREELWKRGVFLVNEKCDIAVKHKAEDGISKLPTNVEDPFARQWKVAAAGVRENCLREYTQAQNTEHVEDAWSWMPFYVFVATKPGGTSRVVHDYTIRGHGRGDFEDKKIQVTALNDQFKAIVPLREDSIPGTLAKHRLAGMQEVAAGVTRAQALVHQPPAAGPEAVSGNGGSAVEQEQEAHQQHEMRRHTETDTRHRQRELRYEVGRTAKAQADGEKEGE